MDAVYLILFFLFGLCFGSFFCVVGTRLGRDENFLKGRSHCDICNHPLAWYDMIPLLSFLFQKGKCRYCKAPIFPLSFFVELFTGLLFMISYYSFGFSYDLVIALLSISLTMIVISSDLLYFIIPDEVLLFFSICFLVVQFFRLGPIDTLLQLGSGILLFLIMYGLLCLGNLLFKKESLGGGDVKLLFVIGLVLNPFLGLISIFLASFIALPISLLLYYFKKEKMIPFGPFLLLSFLLIFFSKVTTEEIVRFILSISMKL